jgi:hypothetical protein
LTFIKSYSSNKGYILGNDSLQNINAVNKEHKMCLIDLEIPFRETYNWCIEMREASGIRKKQNMKSEHS